MLRLEVRGLEAHSVVDVQLRRCWREGAQASWGPVDNVTSGTMSLVSFYTSDYMRLSEVVESR